MIKLLSDEEIAKLGRITSVIEDASTMSGGQVDQLTAQGWKLVAIVPEQRVEQKSEWQNGQYVHSYSQPRTTSRFILGMPEESTLAQLYESAQATQRAYQEIRNEKQKLERECDDRKASFSKALEEVEHWQKLYYDRDEEIADLRAKGRRYEDDIAKIRQALGDLRMKEILGK